MNGFDRQQALVALAMLAMALIVSAGYPPLARWRAQLKIASIVLFAAAVALAFVEIAVWLVSRPR